MKNRWGLLLLGVVVALCLTPSLSMADASTDYSEMADWMKMTANQGSIPEGTTITMSNWQQYKQFMPLGMIKLFQGVYNWKMPQDVSMTVGPMTEGGVPSTWVAATEKYGPQTGFKILPNGHYLLENYHGGTPFPNPQDPQKGWKIMVNAYYAFVPALYVNAPENYATVWAIDKYGDVAPSTLILTYRWTDYITDANFPPKYDYSPGTWYAEWAMQETPEQARYTASLSMFYTDQEAHPFPDTFVFVPALRRSLRLSASSRCSPVFGFDWTYDDAKTNGFNGTTSIYTGDYLGNRKILTLAHFNTDGADLPAGYDMPLAWPKPSWGKWEVRPMILDDVHRIASEAPGYCYSHRVMYIDLAHWNGDWVDLYDSNAKLWKSIAYLNDIGNVPGLGNNVWDGVASMAWDLQNTHMTVWSGFGNQWKRKPFLDNNAPKEWFNGVKYATPSGLMQIMR